MSTGLDLQQCTANRTTRMVGIVADAGGHDLKRHLVGMLREAGAEVMEFGDHLPTGTDDRMDFVLPLARAIAGGQIECGVATCGSGVGASVIANKIDGVRACLIHDPVSAHQGVEDDDLNLMCLGGHVVGPELAWELVRIFLTARFSIEERHGRIPGTAMTLENSASCKGTGVLDGVGAGDGQVHEVSHARRSDLGGPLRIYLIRHGQTEWSLSGQYSGRADIGLTVLGEEEARTVGKRLRDITFAHVLTSPQRRAQRTCELAGLEPVPTVEPDLAEWDNGDDEGRTSGEILQLRPEWKLFRDGSPNGESPAQISERADRLIEKVRGLSGNVALFTHSHFGRVFGVRWIGLPVSEGQHLLLGTGSVSVLCHEHERSDQPAIAIWNSCGMEPFKASPRSDQDEGIVLKQRAIDRWEGEGGEIPGVPIPH